MYSVILFFMTLAQLSAIAMAFAMGSQMLFSSVAIYGSPFYIIIHLLGNDSAFLETNHIYIGFALFHVIKYFCFFRSQMVEDGNILRSLAIIMEMLYLGICAYYSL
jgi:hypothetical protein